MKRSAVTLAFAAIALAAPLAQAADFALSSDSLKRGGAIGAEYYWNDFGCTGGNVMPELHWKNAPAGTKSYAVTFYDKDAPTGSGFWHWVAYNIPAQTQALPGGANGSVLPAGTVEGNTDLGKPGFFGPCPPVGRLHHYIYTVHALKVDKLPVDSGATAALVGFYLWQNDLATATFEITAGPRK
jgi:Raf kinase inhibitor-like YbhB/YbcL family protein